MAPTAPHAPPLDRGRSAFARRAWHDAQAELAAADLAAPLGPEDLERLAVAGYLAGDELGSDEARVRAHHAWLHRGDRPRAARCAFWLAYRLLGAGDLPRASGWAGRARRLLDEDGRPDCAERGYLRCLTGLQALFERDAARAYAAFGEASQAGERFRDPDLLTLARHGAGRALIRLGGTDEGSALLDGAMVAVQEGEVSPVVAGEAYCGRVEACREILDVRRARTWTEALGRWCAGQPQLVPYRGRWLLHHAETLHLRGSWTEALAAARRACAVPGGPETAARCLLGELHRLRGAYGDAEAGFRLAADAGADPQPGLALLRLAQGRTDAAVAAVLRLAGEMPDGGVERARFLPAYVEVMLASHDLVAAREASEELTAVGALLGTPRPRAAAAQARGAVLLAEGDARSAVPVLRGACGIWSELEIPYEAARARTTLALACRAAGDADAAARELSAARAEFARLGAAGDLFRLDASTGG
ncbi:DNA-binding response regulator [Streptomyces sp. HNM0663]|uniref:DNA-binding response regulator n=1 Tax=Streptomyces chengmaiensis TaxID=3040919 RepID=A0ABT6HL73_9ACTN|nr:DNA-binding response regulator [Streptomyces chengmaiensis]MDH2389453.1 DNA-binding response regulator [Streptomyces chengmaiensis]